MQSGNSVKKCSAQLGNSGGNIQRSPGIVQKRKYSAQSGNRGEKFPAQSKNSAEKYSVQSGNSADEYSAQSVNSAGIAGKKYAARCGNTEEKYVNFSKRDDY